jgi:NADH-quinone oxidoreductase subunit N
MAYSLAILLFSMSGIPPLAGFFGKLMVFQAAVASELYVLAVLGVLTSVVAAFYYLRVIKVMFFDEAIDPFDKQVAFAKRAVIAVSVVFALVFILAPDTLIDNSRDAAAALFGG